MNSSVKGTVGNRGWLIAHEDELKKTLPSDWTEPKQLDLVRFGYALKVMGCDWRSPTELSQILSFLTKVRIIQVDDREWIRANPERVLPYA